MLAREACVSSLRQSVTRQEHSIMCLATHTRRVKRPVSFKNYYLCLL
jgi:hypothetical protein